MADKSSSTLVISADERERVVKLRAAFREQLNAWMTGVTIGVRYTDQVARALAESMFEVGVVAWMSSAGALGNNEHEADKRASALFAKLMVFLEAEITS